jgi:nucleoside-diphosphate-sugar epimerase
MEDPRVVAASGASLDVLVTGAFGTLGRATVRELLAQGHRVRCLDVPGRRNRRLAARLPRDVEVVWGDVRTAGSLEAMVADRDAVIHDAAVLPPLTERAPELAWAVNVEGTRNLVAALERTGRRPLVVFPSSVTVFGADPARTRPLTVDDPVVATDHYTRHKLACEELLRASGVRWAILRVGVAVDPQEPGGAPEALRGLFEVSPENRLEWVHPADVARAQVNALRCSEAWGRVLLVGGGSACRVRHRDLLDAFFAALGLGRVPRQAFGTAAYYTDWMDTAESERLLGYQGHTFDEFRRDLARSLRPVRWSTVLVRPFLRRYLLGLSGPWRRAGHARMAQRQS